MWWKLLLGAAAIAAVYVPLAASAMYKARQKREKEQLSADLPEEKNNAGDAPD